MISIVSVRIDEKLHGIMFFDSGRSRWNLGAARIKRVSQTDEVSGLTSECNGKEEKYKYFGIR